MKRRHVNSSSVYEVLSRPATFIKIEAHSC